MVRVSDARMSGTSFGTCVLHVAPDAASGGPLALARTGDRITLDTNRHQLHLHIDDHELDRRRHNWRPPVARHRRGWPRLYDEHVLQATRGADLDFLVPATPADAVRQDPIIGRS